MWSFRLRWCIPLCGASGTPPYRSWWPQILLFVCCCTQRLNWRCRWRWILVAGTHCAARPRFGSQPQVLRQTHGENMCLVTTFSQYEAIQMILRSFKWGAFNNIKHATRKQMIEKISINSTFINYITVLSHCVCVCTFFLISQFSLYLSNWMNYCFSSNSITKKITFSTFSVGSGLFADLYRLHMRKKMLCVLPVELPGSCRFFFLRVERDMFVMSSFVNSKHLKSNGFPVFPVWAGDTEWLLTES